MSEEISQEEYERLYGKNVGLDIEAEMARILKEEIMIEFAKIGVTQEDIDRPMIEALKNLMKTKDKVRIDMEEVISIQKRTNEINETELNKIEFYYQNKKIDIDNEAVEEWRFTGMTNFGFARDFVMDRIEIND